MITKALITFLSFSLFTQLAFSQKFERIFLEEDFLGYDSALFKFDESVDFERLDYTFFNSIDEAVLGGQSSLLNDYEPGTFGDDETYMPTTEELIEVNDFIKTIDDLTFRVTAFYQMQGYEINGRTDEDYPFVVLELKGSDKNWYFVRYEPQQPGLFYFDVILTKPLFDYCAEFEEEIIEENKSITLTSPLTYEKLDGDSKLANPVVTVKIEEEKKSVFLSLNVNNNRLGRDLTGVEILFEDGESIKKEDVKVTTHVVMNGTWEYRAVVELNDDDLKLLSEKRIKSFKLSDYERKLRPRLVKNTKEYIKCAVSASLDSNKK